MNRKIIWIVLGALLLLVLVVLLWWWFLGQEPTTPAPAGGLGTSETRPGGGGGGSGAQTNIGTSILGDRNVPPGSQGGSGGSGSGGSGISTISTSSLPGVSGVSGVSWLGGGSIFNPTPVNQVDSGTIGGLPSIGGGGGSGQSGGLSFTGALLGAGVAGAVACSASLFVGQAVGGTAVVGSTIYSATGLPVSDLGTHQILAYQAGIEITGEKRSFLDCITRAIKRAVLQQMTASIVNWINSGFNGKPSFVQNYQQFFTNVADVAAGEYIRGSSLSFLCSPFQLQVRIAIARSYARRNASQCSLTGVIKNVNSFMQGNFSAGGWPGLLAFTTTPTNNPYGAYMYAEVGLISAQSNALQAANRRIGPGGFLDFQEAYDCVNNTVVKDAAGNPTKLCKYRTTTPGKVIGDSLNTALGTPFRQNELAQSFDEIIGALMNQLITRTLQGGLSNLSSPSGYGGTGQQTSAEAQVLLTALQGAVSMAQQYGYTKQGSIGDIQNAQQQLQTLANCWDGKSSTNKTAALDKIAQLETRVAALNNQITRANSAIAKIQDFQTRLFSAVTSAQIQAVATDFSAAQSSGILVTQADVTSAQQDRASIQTEMATLNQQTAAELNQCNASF